jgi:tetratricopeptide (TPR) repeat protein
MTINSRDSELSTALHAARERPSDFVVWDALEAQAARAQAPEPVTELYVEVLQGELSPASQKKLRERALRFSEEWFGDDAEQMQALLVKVFELEPTDDVLFERVVVSLTAAGRWDRLLHVYDVALAASDSLERRIELLTEAAKVAKDLASDEPRALALLQSLLALRPDDAAARTQTEKLLERSGRFHELVLSLERQAQSAGSGGAGAAELDARIAAIWLRELQSAPRAFEIAAKLLESDATDPRALVLVEEIFGSDAAPLGTRRAAFALLSELYDKLDRPLDKTRVTRASTSLFEGAERELRHREAARLLREREPAEALSELAEAFVRSPNDDALLRELEEHAMRTNLEAPYADTLERAAARAETSLRRYQLTLRAAGLRQRVLGESARAVELYRSVLGQDEARAAALEAGRALDAIFDAAEDQRSRLAVLARLAELESVPEVRRELLGGLARVALALGDKDQALFAYKQRLEAHARDQEALDGLVELYEERRDFLPLIEVLRQRASTLGGRLAARDFARIGQIYAEELFDLDKALAALDELHAASPELAGELSIGDLLERSARREVEDTARLSTALGEAYRNWLSDADRALAHYARALAADPTLATARAGLVALLSEERVRGRAADVLATAYASSEDVAGLLELLPHRLATANSAAERARLLRQAAQLEAARRAAPEAAFVHAAAALVEDPTDAAVDLELWRLAEQLGTWKELVLALHQAADKVDAALPRYAQLRVSEAELSELRLLDLPRAFEAYQAVSKALPGDPALAEAVCRVAALLGRFEDAFDVVVALADRLDQVPDGLLSLLEERAAETGNYLPLAEAARAALARARLNGPLRRELLLRVAEWYEVRADDAAQAEQVLIDAGKLGGPHAETLRRLAVLQRRTPGRALFDTLLAAAELQDRELVQLTEACELARNTLHDQALERTVLERLVERSASLLRAGQRSAHGVAGSSPEDVLVDATVRLADMHSAAGEAAEELALLRASAAAPIAKDKAQQFAERAARLALGALQDSELAIELYQRALELAPNDPGLLAALSAEYDRAGRLDDLVVLRRRELLATPSVSRRLELRLELSRVQGELEARGGRLAALRENLREVPGHSDSIDAAERILRQQGALTEVFSLLSGEASQLEAIGETYRAAALWSRAAVLADEELHDEERALTAYQKLAGLEHDERALDALARIRLRRGEPGLAVPWLERSLETRPTSARVQVRLRLARAHQAAGNLEAAMTTLEGGIREAPDAFELRDLLADLYERNERLERLAELLADSATRSTDRELLLSYARKAALLFGKRLGEPARSVDVLARAVEVAPNDRPLKLDYVDALIAAERLDAAREVLEAMVNEYGRRRSPERAELHLRLSRVAKGAGQIDEALAQLDNAASMDRAHPAILRALGQLAVEAGQLERAERAYRTLLLIVRKPQGGGEAEGGAAEVLYQLHRIALELGQREKAAELLESAVQTAVHSEEETARLKTLLLERGEPELLLRVLELRLSQVSSPATEAEVLSDLADVLELTLDRKEDAFEARLKALASAPELDALHVSALRVATALGAQKRYADTVLALVERAKRKDDPALVSDLALRAGSVAEHVLADLEGAGAAYRLVTEGAPGYVEAQFALARVAGKLGSEDEERTVLERIAELPDEPAYVEGKRSALYRLIELRVQDPATRGEGLERLGQLVQLQPDYARASHILKVAYERDPADVGTLAALERMARQSGEPGVLLDALERRARLDDVDLAVVREAVELAQKLDDGARVEALLRRALELADARDAAGDAAWAPVLLARTLQKSGDIDGALEWLERAMSVSEPAESFELGLELAALAAESGSARPADRARAIRVYEKLRERDPSDRRVWGPLLTFYKDEGELDHLLAVVRTTLESLDAQVDRNALRLQTARLMFEAEREDEGAQLLQDVLGEDPDHAEAALRLADLYERRGDQERLVELLSRKLESARERRSPSVIPLSLRMGAMLAQTRPDQAAELYRQALALMPENEELLRAAIEQTDADEEAEERAQLIARYLASADAEEKPQALEYVSWLVEHRATDVDPQAYEAALELAHRVAPRDKTLRARLTTWHRERNHHQRLAELLESDARRTDDRDDVGAKERKIALLVEAADLRLDKLNQPSEAAALLRKARELAPGDFELLKRAVQASASSGELGPALAEIDAALEHAGRPDDERIELYRLRAETATIAAMHDEAVLALSAAHELGGEAQLAPLLAGIERARAGARERGNLARERELTLRLASLFRERDELERAIEVLEQWIAHATNDVPALRELLELTFKAQRWDSARVIAERLCGEDEPAALEQDAERLVAASRALGQLELARGGVERALLRGPSAALRGQLEELYLELGDKRALAGILAERSASEPDPERRFEQLRRVGQLLVEAGDADGAMVYLRQALEVKPDDLPTVLAVVDAHISAARSAEARELIERTIGALRQRRSPELGQLRHRMAKLLHTEGDEAGRLEWLNSALEADMNNGEVASELAVVAQDHGHLDTSLKALRAITMMKGEAPMTRAEAFYRQAIIVAQKGEPRRAVLWAKKAKAEDQHFPGVDRLIAELESA